jgi:hypothetical protein
LENVKPTGILKPSGGLEKSALIIPPVFGSIAAILPAGSLTADFRSILDPAPSLQSFTRQIDVNIGYLN